MNERGDLMSLTPKCDMFLKSPRLLQPIWHLPEAIQHIHPSVPPPTPLLLPQNGLKSSKIIKQKLIQNKPKSNKLSNMVQMVQNVPNGSNSSKMVHLTCDMSVCDLICFTFWTPECLGYKWSQYAPLLNFNLYLCAFSVTGLDPHWHIFWTAAVST